MKVGTTRKARQLVRLSVTAVTVLATVGVTTAATSPPSADPAKQADQAIQAEQAEPAEQAALGENLADQLGAKAGGYWIDQDNTVVVNVIDQQAAAKVREAGATPRLVENSTAELESRHESLSGLLTAHTSTGVDVKTNQVVVRVGSKAGDAKAGRLIAAAKRLGEMVRIERFDGGYDTAIYGGDQITDAGGGYCTLGFNTNGGYALTAGHCTQAISQWYDGCTGSFFGTSAAADFPGDDFGAISNSGGLSQPGEVRETCGGGAFDVTGSADPVVGQSVCKSGATTGVTCGSVTATGQTICYSEGCVDNLAFSDAQVLPGDSGGPWYDGSTAVGITSGYYTDGSASFFQPVNEALGAYGLSLL